MATSTVGDPGAQGAAVTGTQGIGVNAPKAAAVAAATVGFAIDWHMPNGKMLTIGLLSIMFAIGIDVMTRFTGSTMSELGATPKLHCSIAPPHTIFPISTFFHPKCHFFWIPHKVLGVSIGAPASEVIVRSEFLVLLEDPKLRSEVFTLWGYFY